MPAFRGTRVCALAVLSLAAAATPASAAEPPETVYGVVDNAGVETLATITTTSGTVTTVGPISGIGAAKVQSMDFRPATGELYALLSDNTLVKVTGLDTATPAAAPVATTPAALTLAGTGEIDFNPVPDAIRVVSSGGTNLRVPLSTGVVATDTALNGAGTGATGAAYTNATAGAQYTTLYDIDAGTLFTQGGLGGSPSPNAGTLANVGGISGTTTALPDGGFDISPSSGRAITLRDNAGARQLVQVDVASGTATNLVAASDTTFHAIAIRPAAAAISFVAAASGVGENAGTATVTLRRTGNVNATVTVPFTIGGTATAGSDIGTPTASPVVFSPGDTTKTVSIPVTQDKVAESAETVTVTLGAPTGGINAAPTVHTVTISDDDAAYAAEAEKVFALDDAGTLHTFSTATPGTLTTIGAVTGLAGGEELVGIDVQPRTGRLIGVSSASKVYAINKATAAATQIGSTAFTPAVDGTSFGVDFNPVPNAIRFLSSGGAAGQSLRISPDTGAVLGTDTAPAGVTVADAAYTNSVNGANSTTLYVIDSADDTVKRIGGLGGSPSPNGGTVTLVGALGVDTNGDVGFDVSGASNVAYATLQSTADTAVLHKVDLASGAVSTGAPIGASATDVVDIAVDAAVPSVQLSGAAFAVRENAGNAVVTITRTGNTDGVSNVTLTTGTTGTATPGTDFTALSAQAVQFAAGETSKTVNVAIADDSAVEDSETIAFSIALAAASPGASLGAPNAGTITVFDNDPTQVAGPTVTVNVPVLVTANQVLLTAAPNQVKRSSLAKGLKLTASCAETCSLSYTLKLGSTTLGTAKAQRTGAGIVAVKLSLSTAGKRALTTAFASKKVKSKLLTLTGSATDSDGGKAATDTVKVRVLR